MMRQLRLIFGCIVILMGFDAARAQDAPAPAAKPTADSKAKAADDATPVLSAPHDPAADTIVDSNPTTPAQLLKAALLLADLDRLDLAKKYVAQLAAAKPDEKALVEAAGQIDPAMLIRIMGNKDLPPEAAQIASAVLAAAGRMARDPGQMRMQIDRLADPSEGIQKAAAAQILAAHEDAVPGLLLALADQKRETLHPRIRQLLVKIGEQALPPLVAALATENVALKIQIIDVLRQIGSRDAVPFLLAPAVSAKSSPEVRDAVTAALAELAGSREVTTSDAIKLLTREIDRDLKNERPPSADASGKMTVWRWNATAGVPVRETVSTPLALATSAARLAGDLLELAPNDRSAQRLFLTTTLEAAALWAGVNNPIQLKSDADVDRAAGLGVAAIEDALVVAMAEGRMAAATAAAQILGSIGDRSLLQARDGQVRPLVQAVAQGDRRLRFAAAEAIMKLKPASAFAGSSDLLAALAMFADSPGIKRALVAHPNAVAASDLAAQLAGLGYEVDTVGNGRQAYLQAISSDDYELILLSGRLDHPPVWAVLQQLRRDPRAGGVPIALMAEDELVEPDRLKSMADDDPLTAVFLRPIEPAGVKFHVDRLLEKIGGQIIPAELRQKQALAALGWLKQLNEVSPKDFDVRPYEAQLTRAFQRPLTSAAAAELLANIGTHTAQKSLTEMANSPSQPIGLRETAAAAFSRAVRKHGIQLTTGEIRKQYDRYNQSSIENRETQQLLGLMLDAIEAPTKK